VDLEKPLDVQVLFQDAGGSTTFDVSWLMIAIASPRC